MMSVMSTLFRKSVALFSALVLCFSLVSCETIGKQFTDYLSTPAGQQAIKDAQDIAIRVIGELIGGLAAPRSGGMTMSSPQVQAAILKSNAAIKAKYPELDEQTINVISTTAARAELRN